MTKVRVYVAYKASILDPQAQAIKAATHKMGYQEVTELNVGKFFDFEFDAITGLSGYFTCQEGGWFSAAVNFNNI